MPAPPTPKPHTRVGDICEPRRLVQSVRPRVVCEANAAGVARACRARWRTCPCSRPPAPRLLWCPAPLAFLDPCFSLHPPSGPPKPRGVRVDADASRRLPRSVAPLMDARRAFPVITLPVVAGAWRSAIVLGAVHKHSPRVGGVERRRGLGQGTAARGCNRADPTRARPLAGKIPAARRIGAVAGHAELGARPGRRCLGARRLAAAAAACGPSRPASGGGGP